MPASSVKLNKQKLEAIIRQSPERVDNLLGALAFDGEAFVKRSMGESPSRPGEPPGVITGTLRASIHVERPKRWIRRITTAVDYAHYLEFGTSRMAARPFMTPMVYYLRKQIPVFWKRFIEQSHANDRA